MTASEEGYEIRPTRESAKERDNKEHERDEQVQVQPGASRRGEEGY